MIEGLYGFESSLDDVADNILSERLFFRAYLTNKPDFFPETLVNETKQLSFSNPINFPQS